MSRIIESIRNLSGVRSPFSIRDHEDFRSLAVRSPLVFKDTPIIPKKQTSFGSGAYELPEGFNLPDINPDDVIAKQGIAAYRRAYHRDEQIKAAIKFKVLARLASGLEVVPDPDAKNIPSHQDQVAYVKHVLQRAKGTINGLVRDLLDGMVMGFSPVEKVLMPLVDGPFRNKIGISHFHKLDQEFVEIKSSDRGQILDDGIWQEVPLSGAAGAYDYIRLKRDDFLLYVHDKENDNFYGNSDIRACWRWYVAKDVNIREWAFRLETFGQPFVWAEAGPGAGEDRTTVLTILKQMRRAGYAVVPAGYKLNVLDHSEATTHESKEFLGVADRGIARSCLLPSLLAEHGDVGSYALGEKHQEQFVWVLNEIAEQLEEEIFHEQMIKPLIDLNYPGVEFYPRLKFNDYEQDDLKLLSEILETLVNAGLEVPRAWVHRKYDIPEPEIDKDGITEEVLKKGSSSPSPNPFEDDLLEEEEEGETEEGDEVDGKLETQEFGTATLATKTTAANLVRDQVRRGTKSKPSKCMSCGKVVPKKDLIGHHTSYGKENKVKVEWLCRECHGRRHRGKKSYSDDSGLKTMIETLESKGYAVEGLEVTSGKNGDGAKVQVFTRKSLGYWRDPTAIEAKVDFTELDTSEALAEEQASENVALILGETMERTVERLKKKDR